MGRVSSYSLLFPLILTANVFSSQCHRRMDSILSEKFKPFKNSVWAEFPLFCQYIYPWMNKQLQVQCTHDCNRFGCSFCNAQKECIRLQFFKILMPNAIFLTVVYLTGLDTAAVDVADGYNIRM